MIVASSNIVTKEADSRVVCFHGKRINLTHDGYIIYSILNSKNKFGRHEDVYDYLKIHYNDISRRLSLKEINEFINRLSSLGFVINNYDPLFKKNLIFKNYLRKHLNNSFN